jgi:hypothetical protein
MKTNLTLFFIMLYLTGFSQVEWAPIGAEWYYSYREGASTPSTGYYLLQSLQDTIIDSKACKVIGKTLVDSKGNMSFQGNEYLYSNPETNKMYRYLYDKFWLLYDFSVIKGDTITIKEPFSTTDYDSVALVVDSVAIESISDSIELQSLFLKRIFDLSSPGLNFSGKIIEKTGNLNYFFPYYELDCDGGCPQPLRCYSDLKIDYTSNYQYPCDTIYTYTKLLKKMDIQIYPNPFQNFLTIDIGKNNYKHLDIELFNNIGQSILKKRCFSNKMYVEMSNYPKGNYIISISNGMDEVLKKIVKL